MYCSVYSFGKPFQTRLAGPFERPSGVGYHVEIHANSGADSISFIGDVNQILNLAEQFQQIAQEIMRAQFAGGRKDEQNQLTESQP